MNFCQECSNILYPEEDKENKKLKLVCKKDGLEYDPVTNCIYVHNFGEEIRSTKEDRYKRFGSDKTLLRTFNVRCPKCYKSEAVHYQDEEKENVSLFLVCANCGHIIGKGKD